ncbi:hypothetical protein Gorai_003190 [Gossypium raimondii]|uniref:RNA exonuclease 4 n=1 Tax=Gossypium raimondii TaxID=29730 RepID=A0A7J8QP20_GOSRA|nr:hypothetical protein [Gossypium raimondii]
MSSERKKNPKHFQLNPNWAQLQQKLKSFAKPSRHSKNPQSETPNSILGKRKERPNSEPDDAKPNPLMPTNDDSRLYAPSKEVEVGCFDSFVVFKGYGYCNNFNAWDSKPSHICNLLNDCQMYDSVTDVLAMDCEMVGVGQGNKSALGRVTVVNKWRNVIYDEFVRPVEHVVDFRTRISGIRPRDLRKAKDFRVVQKKVAELIKGRILVGHALHNDLKALLLMHPKKDLRDTSEYQPFLKEGRRKALRHLAAEVLGVEIQNGEHCPVDDARAAMLLYSKNRKEWERSVKDQLRLKEKQKKRKQRKKPKADINHSLIAS